MPVTVVVGGQFGSEGKGKVAHFLSAQMRASAVVRVGGSNAGHTVIDSFGNPIVFRQLPTASLLPNVICGLAAGSYISPNILFDEISRTGLTKDRLLIDPNAVIITEDEELRERSGSLRKSIGSTLSGTGAAVQRRLDRRDTAMLARNEPSLADYIRPVADFLRNALTANKRVLIEGTQGFGLSVLHSDDYPFVTSRDTTAAAFVSEVGLSPLDVDDIVMVLRAFPIRVGGNSGPLPNEIDWTAVTKESGSSTPIIEHTSVTKTVRRVARFDPTIVRHAIAVNTPTRIVLNHLDYIDSTCAGENRLSKKDLRFLDEIETGIDTPIDYVGLGPSSLLQHPRESARFKRA
jgi:adenylosuccinate synthase